MERLTEKRQLTTSSFHFIPEINKLRTCICFLPTAAYFLQSWSKLIWISFIPLQWIYTLPSSVKTRLFKIIRKQANQQNKKRLGEQTFKYPCNASKWRDGRTCKQPTHQKRKFQFNTSIHAIYWRAVNDCRIF